MIRDDGGMRRPPPARFPSQHLPLAEALDRADRLVVRQSRDWVELVAFEAANKYALLTPDGALAGMMLEEQGGAGAFLTRWWLKANRPFDMGVYAYEDPRAPLLRFHRPWTWFFSRIEVSDGAGRPLGVVRRRWSWLRRTFDVEAPDGRLLARLVGPLLHPWTFVLREPRTGAELGRIAKEWTGSVSEWVTDADTFLVVLPEGQPALRRLALAAAVLVDFMYFEGRD